MAVKPVQVSMDADLLQRVDEDEETQTRGRSAFVRSAIELYLVTKRRQRIDAQIAAAYRGKADRLLGEAVDVIDAQVWPDD
jgi:metal-responsive CopG/Arc/MetJ family transcriptional regulator